MQQMTLFSTQEPEMDPRIQSFRRMADNLQKEINEKRNPAIGNQNLTSRRARIADGMGKDADNLEKIQLALRGMADDLAAGTLPGCLEKISSRAQVEHLLLYGYYPPNIHNSNLKDIQRVMDKVCTITIVRRAVLDIIARMDPEACCTYLHSADEARALQEIIRLANKGPKSDLRWCSFDSARIMQQINAGATDEAKFKEVHAALANYLRPPDPEVLRKRKIKELEAKLIGQKIDGFFPTPRPVIELMLQHADIRAGHSVLEPSCGKGDIAEVIMEKYPDIYHLHLVEWNYQLIEICRAKGMYPAQLDFLDYEQKVDRIVMNPPFEHGQDIDHIRHAYDLLNPEGRMVTIVSEGPFFRQGKKEEDFRYWIYELGYLAHEIQLGAGAFTGKESFRQTGIATRILIIEKDE